MFIVESGVVTCHMDFLRLHHRMHLPPLSQDVLAVAPVRSATLPAHCIQSVMFGLLSLLLALEDW